MLIHCKYPHKSPEKQVLLLAFNAIVGKDMSGATAQYMLSNQDAGTKKTSRTKFRLYNSTVLTRTVTKLSKKHGFSNCGIDYLSALHKRLTITLRPRPTAPFCQCKISFLNGGRPRRAYVCLLRDPLLELLDLQRNALAQLGLRLHQLDKLLIGHVGLAGKCVKNLLQGQ